MNTAFYIYGNIRLKEISILNKYKKTLYQARLFRLGLAARPWFRYTVIVSTVIEKTSQVPVSSTSFPVESILIVSDQHEGDLNLNIVANIDPN